MIILWLVGALGAVAMAFVSTMLICALWRNRQLEREWRRFVMDPVRSVRGGNPSRELSALWRRYPDWEFHARREPRSRL